MDIFFSISIRNLRYCAHIHSKWRLPRYAQLMDDYSLVVIRKEKVMFKTYWDLLSNLKRLYKTLEPYYHELLFKNYRNKIMCKSW